MLVLSREPEQGIMIGEAVEVRVLEIHGGKVRLGIIAPQEVSVHRKEVFLNIQRENQAAAAAQAAGLAGAIQLLGRSAGAGKGIESGAKPAPPSDIGRAEHGRAEQWRAELGREAGRDMNRSAAKSADATEEAIVRKESPRERGSEQTGDPKAERPKGEAASSEGRSKKERTLWP